MVKHSQSTTHAVKITFVTSSTERNESKTDFPQTGAHGLKGSSLHRRPPWPLGLVNRKPTQHGAREKEPKNAKRK